MPPDRQTPMAKSEEGHPTVFFGVLANCNQIIEVSLAHMLAHALGCVVANIACA
jgi:hypothetical protein